MSQAAVAETSQNPNIVSAPGTAKHIAVIGAGAAGLCAAKHLIEVGLDVTVFEIGTQVGVRKAKIDLFEPATEAN